jgi:DNA-binding GntR family transcriptional regulator
VRRCGISMLKMSAQSVDDLAAPRSLSLSVRAELERMIMSGALPPGARLNEVALAKRLNVSRGPVREAARLLEKTGLVTVIMNRGAFVRTLTVDEALEIYDFTIVLLGFAAMQLAETASFQQMSELRDLVERMEQAAVRGDSDQYFALNLEFHERLFAFSRNRAAEAVYLVHAKKLLLLRRKTIDELPNMAKSNGEHRAILDAIMTRQPDLARQMAERHAHNGRHRFLLSIEQPPTGLGRR